MKRILVFLSVMGIVFFISGRATAQTVNKPPIRTMDPHPAFHPVTPSLPMKGGAPAGSKFVLPVTRLTGQQPAGGLKATAMPIKQSASGAAVTDGQKNATPAPNNKP